MKSGQKCEIITTVIDSRHDFVTRHVTKAAFKMNIFAKKDTRKNTKISFRTDDETLTHLKSICRIENRTISSLIEEILTEHVLIHENPLLIEKEKRLTPRKKCSIPAVVVFKTKIEKYYYNSLIISLSENSAQIVLKNLYQDDILENEFSILFNLPKTEYPLLFKCNIARSKRLDNECIVVANFIHEDDLNAEELKKFLLTNELSCES